MVLEIWIHKIQMMSNNKKHVTHHFLCIRVLTSGTVFLTTLVVYIATFSTYEGSEAQRGEVTCPRPPSHKAVEPRVYPHLSDSLVYSFLLIKVTGDCPEGGGVRKATHGEQRVLPDG